MRIMAVCSFSNFHSFLASLFVHLTFGAGKSYSASVGGAKHAERPFTNYPNTVEWPPRRTAKLNREILMLATCVMPNICGPGRIFGAAREPTDISMKVKCQQISEPRAESVSLVEIFHRNCHVLIRLIEMNCASRRLELHSNRVIRNMRLNG